jgi:hypothetical protein
MRVNPGRKLPEADPADLPGIIKIGLAGAVKATGFSPYK